MNSESPMEKAMREAGIKPPAKVLNRGRGVLQNCFLDNLINKKSLVEIDFLDGSTLKATLFAYDEYCLLLKAEQLADQKLVFKHSVKSIKPL